MGGKSIFLIVVIGAGGVVVVVILMMMFLGSLEQLPEGRAVKLALTVAEQFNVEGVKIVKVRRAGAEFALVIDYRTKNRAPGVDGPVKEMDGVGKLVYDQYGNDPDVARIKSVEVKRVQVTGSGCFRRTVEYQHQFVPVPPAPKAIREIVPQKP